MTSAYPPPTIPSLDTGTLPGGWSEPDVPEESQAAKELEKQTVRPSDESKPITTRNQLSTGATVVQTAKQYIPEQVGKAVDYAAQTAVAAASYLPDRQGIQDTLSSYVSSGEHREEPHVSLPSTELKGAQPFEYSGGVGALPGNLSESSVALLPDQRQEREKERLAASPLQTRDTIKPSTVVGDNGTQSRESEEEETKETGDASPFKDEPVASEPSGAPPEARAAEFIDSGIASRSGPGFESQEEGNETKDQQDQQAQSEQGEKTDIAGTDAVTAPSAEELGERQEDVEEPGRTSEQLGQSKGLSQDVQKEGSQKGMTTVQKVEGSYGEGYHPAQLHPPPPGASVAEYQASLGVQQEEQILPETKKTTKRASVGAEKKPRFITAVKGEMKILAGKISGHEDKVEEGKKIIRGEV